jgi:hypothetical protein
MLLRPEEPDPVTEYVTVCFESALWLSLARTIAAAEVDPTVRTRRTARIP